MNESRWEASRRSARKSGIVVFLIFIAVAVVSGILFVNNRDLIDDTPHANTAAAAKDTAPAGVAERAAGHAADTGSAYSAEISRQTDSQATDTSPENPAPEKPMRQVAAVLPEVAQPAEASQAARHESATVTAHAAQPSPQIKASPPPAPRPPASIRLPPFECRVDSRKDVVIYLSLELFFEDAEKRSSLLLRREDIRVMVMRTLRGKLLGEITTGKLEAELRSAINELFDHGEIVAVTIRDIRIEKAVKE